MSKLSLEEHCRCWCYTYRGALEYLKNPLVMRYEDLVRDSHSEVRRVVDYLGLELQDEQITNMQSNRGFGAHGTSRNREASIGRWRRDLTNSDVEVIESICGQEMLRHSYPLSLRADDSATAHSS
jgi:phenylalanyl-tRNA synthetase beta subunit